MARTRSSVYSARTPWEAEAAARYLIKIEPENSRSWITIATVSTRLLHKEEALQAYEHAARLQPGEVRLRSFLQSRAHDGSWNRRSLLRLSDAGLRSRKTKAVYLDHPFSHGSPKALSGDRSNRLLGVIFRRSKRFAPLFTLHGKKVAAELPHHDLRRSVAVDICSRRHHAERPLTEH